ncbi:hypothetical protein MUP77_18995 [Candidatus Bathyarchaeota archaeon]|nr:hypothetical protein [Candidatus Bathyarchaeota archaeon]
MRKDIRWRPQTLIKALENLGYRSSREMEWRRRNFHAILNPRKNKVTINLHVEIDKISSCHHSRQHGKDITKEFERIKQEYRRLRSQPITPSHAQASRTKILLLAHA